MDYVPRLLDEERQKRLASTGAVVIEAPKACGRTPNARQVAASEDLLNIDKGGRRADISLVIETADGRWSAFEIKLGSER